MMKTFFLFLAISLFAFASCKKDKNNNDNGNNCSLSDANLAGNYKVTSIKLKATSSSPETEVIDDYLDACAKDDIINLKSDHMYAYSDAGTVCTPSGDDTGTWSLSGSSFSLDDDPDTVQTIDNFNCTGFTGSATDTATGGIITITYTKQ